MARIRDLTYDIKEVTLKLADPPELDFRAGQYVQFEVPAYELTDEPVYRAYSISSPPRCTTRWSWRSAWCPTASAPPTSTST